MLQKFTLGICNCGCKTPIPIRDRYRHKIRMFVTHHNIRKGEKCPSWGGGRMMNVHGYVLVRSPDHPFVDCNGYVRENRLVMEQHLGRYLLPTEHVHHINGIKTDNRIENLQVLTSSEHGTLEMKMRWAKNRNWRKPRRKDGAIAAKFIN